MSAEAQSSLQSSFRADGSTRAIYFGSGDQTLFGWLHCAPSGVRGDLGIVICPPFGYEAICAHRGMRACAESMAASGMPALRFDYSGTGDSSDIDPAANQIQAWTVDILAAVGELRLRTGVRRVCLIGFRLGALLAALAAAQSDAVNALVVAYPVFAGRRYLRELRITRMSALLRSDPPEQPKGKGEATVEGMEVSGFSLSAATLAALETVDVFGPQSSPLPPVLVIDSARSVTPGTPALSADAERNATRIQVPGLIEMLMTPPQFALVPTEMIAATIDWLSKFLEPPPEAPNRTARRPMYASDANSAAEELTLAGGMASPQTVTTERPVFFGPDALLFGIVAQPPVAEMRRRAVILLNAGADHHIGASRIYVSMARRWARHGYVVLRMDLAGLGDSGTRPGKADDDVFPYEALNDIRAAIDFLRSSYGIRDVTLAGLCSGAYHALRAAVAGLAVNRILMVNPQNYFWKEGETLNDLQLAEVIHNSGVYRERVFSLAAWKRLVAGDVNVVRIAKIYFQRPLLALESTLRDAARRLHFRLPNDLGTELEEVVSRGVRVVFVFARGEPGIELLKLQAGNSVDRLGERCRIHTIDGGDHVFTSSGPRVIMEKIVTDELLARPEWVDIGKGLASDVKS